MSQNYQAIIIVCHVVSIRVTHYHVTNEWHVFNDSGIQKRSLFAYFFYNCKIYTFLRYIFKLPYETLFSFEALGFCFLDE